MASSHVAARDVSSIIVHGLRLRGGLVETRARKARGHGSWCVLRGPTSIVASKVVGDRVPAMRIWLTRRCMDTGIASRRQAGIDREMMTVHGSGGHGESSSIARVLDVLAVLTRAR